MHAKKISIQRNINKLNLGVLNLGYHTQHLKSLLCNIDYNYQLKSYFDYNYYYIKS